MEPRKEAIRHLEAAADGDGGAMVEVGIAAVYALLHLSDAVRHGLRDIIYELRS
ncbi:MAG: hypothetical protein ACPHID_04970 [Thermoplasmatota archaeon]